MTSLPPQSAVGQELKKIIFFKYVYVICILSILVQVTEANVWGQCKLIGIFLLLKKATKNLRVQSDDEQIF